MAESLRACGGLLFVIEGPAVRVLRGRAVVALWRFASPVVDVSEAGSQGSFLVLDADGRLATATIDRDDRSAEVKPSRLPCPPLASMPRVASVQQQQPPQQQQQQQQQPQPPQQQQQPGRGDMFEQDIRLGKRPAIGEMPAAKRARVGDEDASGRSLGQCERASCAVWAAPDAVYCGRVDRPLARCGHNGGRLAIDSEGLDGGVRYMVAVGVDSADGVGGADSWPGLVRIDARLMGALCGTELALRERPILLQGGADGSVRASAAPSDTAPQVIAQHTVCTLHEPIACVIALRSVVVLVGAAGRLLVITAGPDGARQTYQRQLPGPIGSAVVLGKPSERGDLSDTVLLVGAGRSLYATGLQQGGSGGMAALHRLPMDRAVVHVAEAGDSDAAILLSDTASGLRRGGTSRLLWLTSQEVLQHMRSGLYTLDSAVGSSAGHHAAAAAAAAAAAQDGSSSSVTDSGGAAALRLKNILAEISTLSAAEQRLETDRKDADGRLAAVHGAVSALHLYSRAGGSPPRVGFRFKSVPSGQLHQHAAHGDLHSHARDGGSTQIALEVLFDNPAVSFALPAPSASKGELWSLSVQLSEVEPEKTQPSGGGGGGGGGSMAPAAVTLAGRRWNFGFSLPHGMQRSARFLAPLTADLVDLARRAPLQLSFHLTMQFGDVVGATTSAGFVLPLYRQSSGQSMVYRQADTLHFLHAVSKHPGRESPAAAAATTAVPCRLATLQQLFHPAASALLTGAAGASSSRSGGSGSGSGDSNRDDGGLGTGSAGAAGAAASTRIGYSAAASSRLELIMCGIHPTLTAVAVGDSGSEAGGGGHRLVVPPQPPACKVLLQILNDGGQGGAVVGALQAEMEAAAAAAGSRDGGGSSDLEARASVAARFGPTGSIVHIGVHRALQTTVIGQGDDGQRVGVDEGHTLAVYRLQMGAESAAVLALLHSALISRALKIDESAQNGWKRLAAVVAPQPALAEAVARLRTAQQQLQQQQQQVQQQEEEGENGAAAEAAAAAAAAGPSLQHRRITKLLGAARDQERPLRRKHEVMCDGQGLADLSADLKSQAANLVEIWTALRSAVPL
jgi:hypothetical protein